MNTMNPADRYDQELEALAQKRDDEIDTSDIPEVTDWSKAVVGKFYRPLKEAISLRLDADVIAWLKANGPGYQTRINTILRAEMVGGKESDINAPQRRSCRTSYRFPSLEKRGELTSYRDIAHHIRECGSIFAYRHE